MKELYDLSFALTKGLGRKTKWRLNRQFSTEEISSWDLMDYQKVLSEREWNHFLKENRLYNIEETKQEQLRLKEKGVKYRAYFDEEFPQKLKNIPDPPLGLYVKGKPAFEKRSIAIVGSRRPTAYGKEMARLFARELAKEGIHIISGMAGGVDSFAHRGALEAGGTTTAVLGSGVDVPYPKENYYLYEQILASGSVISEYPLGKEPLSFHFPERNRIISGLSDAVLVVEAKKKSGSLITADCALEQGKDIYALPGRIGDPYSEGCNWLIREGARLVTEPGQILEEMYELSGKDLAVFHKKDKLLDNKEKIVYDCLGLEPKSMEDIIKETNLTVSEGISIVFRLELQGYIRQIANGYYILNL